MSRRAWIICIAVGLVVLAFLLRTHNNGPAKAVVTYPSGTSGPLPAGPPTVTVPDQNGSDTAPNGGSSTAVNEYEFGNLSPDLRKKLTAFTTLYASWPGYETKQVLLKKLQQQRPFLTNEVLAAIKKQWSLPQITFKLKVKNVNIQSDLAKLSQDPNTAVVTAYVTLAKTFTPVSGPKYTQTSVQPYVIKLHIINRGWRVVSITTQNSG